MVVNFLVMFTFTLIGWWESGELPSSSSSSFSSSSSKDRKALEGLVQKMVADWEVLSKARTKSGTRDESSSY